MIAAVVMLFVLVTMGRILTSYQLQENLPGIKGYAFIMMIPTTGGQLLIKTREELPHSLPHAPSDFGPKTTIRLAALFRSLSMPSALFTIMLFRTILIAWMPSNTSRKPSGIR
jgi:hypothetical protein